MLTDDAAYIAYPTSEEKIIKVIKMIRIIQN